MGKNNGKWIYVLIGTGCGMILSGILMVIIGLQGGQELRQLEQSYVSKIEALEAELRSYEVQSTPMNQSNAESVEMKEEATKESEKEYIWINIPNHYGSTQIASFLEKNKIVADRDAFHQFLQSQNATTKLRTGQKRLPKNGDYEEILTILLGKND